MSDAATLVTPNDEAKKYVKALQRDGLLLLRYLAQRADRPVETTTNGPGTVEVALLLDAPESVAKDAARFAGLLTTIDTLARRAQPATTTTIAITAMEVFDSADLASEQPLRPRDRGRVNRFLTRYGIYTLLLLVTMLTVFLVTRVDEGRRAVAQLEAVRKDFSTNLGEMAKLDPAKDWLRMPPEATSSPPGKPSVYATYCEPESGETPLHPYRIQASTFAQQLCNQYAQLVKREKIIFVQLAAWNCGMVGLDLVNLPSTLWRSLATAFSPDKPGDCAARGCGIDLCTAGGTVEDQDWRRTELRTNATLALLTAYVLPALLGCIGGFISVIRRREAKVDAWTLAPKDGASALVRVMLAGTLGGLLALVLGTDDKVTIGGYSLSLAAWAFFLGYALDPVLKLLDRLIGNVLDAVPLKTPQDKDKVSVSTKT